MFAIAFSVVREPMFLLLVACGTLYYFLGDKEEAAMLLGFVLGPMLEENLRRALLLSRGDPSVFFRRPISLAFLIATALILLTMAMPAVRKRQRQITD